MRYLGIDLGDKRTGLALGDSETRIAAPIAVIEVPRAREDGAALLRELARAIDEHIGDAPAELVLGLPLNMDGTEGDRAKLTRAFGQQLAANTARTLHHHDERLTTAARTARIVTFSTRRDPANDPANAAANAAMISHGSTSRTIPKCFVASAKPSAYNISRAPSTSIEHTAAVPTNASRSSPARTRNTDRSAPWCPLKPPKNPDSAPPTHSQRGETDHRSNRGDSSSTANPPINTASTNSSQSTLARRPPASYENASGAAASKPSTAAPANAAAIAGTPNRSTMRRSADLPISASLNTLFARCTTAVAATATSTGKNTANAGIRIVPNPNPENSVSNAARRATVQTTR
jgi:putative Holliday junction resolvase